MSYSTDALDLWATRLTTAKPVTTKQVLGPKHYAVRPLWIGWSTDRNIDTGTTSHPIKHRNGQATYSLLGLMIVFLAMSSLEVLIGTMSISRYGVMTVYRVIIMDLMSDIVWLIVLPVLSARRCRCVYREYSPSWAVLSIHMQRAWWDDE